MNHTIMRLLPVLFVAVLFSACTTGSLKGTVKAITDPTTDISSSTSGRTWFTEDGLVRNEHQAAFFAAVNFENLKDEMSQGHGEYLASLGSLLGVAGDRQAEFAAWTQANYSQVISSDRTTPDEMVAALHRGLLANPPGALTAAY